MGDILVPSILDILKPKRQGRFKMKPKGLKAYRKMRRRLQKDARRRNRG